MRISDRSSDVCSSNQDRAEGKTGGKKRGPFWKRIRPATLVVLALLVGASMVRAVDPEWVEVLRVKTFDLYQVLSPRPATSQPVAIVDLDEKSLSEIGQWPWPRTVVADLIAKRSEERSVGKECVSTCSLRGSP